MQGLPQDFNRRESEEAVNLDRKIDCAYCRKPINSCEDFYASSWGTSSNAKMPMTSIVGLHWDCTYKILDGWVHERVLKLKRKP